MSAILDPAELHPPLSQWLRLLWDRAPPLRFDAERPCIRDGTIHLPARDEWRHHAAAAAHATAHLVYSPSSFDGTGLGPLARALAGLLEDARVEALAMRELPGLARLWRPLHVATPQLGSDAESLLQRLARALVDPGYDDPDPWVRKGRGLFFIDAALGLSALRTPAEVRRAATLLGHDIGQRRLPFNAKGHAPAPAYRDDHRWMWPVDVPVAPPGVSPQRDDTRAEPVEFPLDAVRYPEWDRLIARLRPHWTQVTETAVVAVEDPPPADAAVRGLRGPLHRLAGADRSGRRDEDGDVFEPSALVEWRVARRLRKATDPRVYRAQAARIGSAALWLLVDQSASAATPDGDAGDDRLRSATRAAGAIAVALQASGVACAIAGFSSAGRDAVRMRVAKTFDAPADRSMHARLQALRPGGSTRLGAALRHAAARVAGRQATRSWVIVLSDADAHDIDIHDPRYLADDARHAVHAAAGRGVRIVALVLGRNGMAQALRVFGSGRARALPGLQALPAALRALLGGA